MATRNPIGSLFGRSPIGPIQKHMEAADRAAQLLPQLFKTTSSEDWETARQVHKEIAEAEKQADKLKRSVRTHLPKSLFLPVPRSDLLDLVGIQDSVANYSKDVAGMVMGRRMRFPDNLGDDMVELAEASANASGQAAAAVNELDELLEVGFTGREVKRVEGMLKELNKMEQRTDRLAHNLRKKLFRIETDLPPVDVVFYYKMIDLVCEVADNAERVGGRLQVLMAR